MTRSAPSEYDYTPERGGGSGASEAAEALKSIGKLFGKAAWAGVRAAPRKVSSIREEVRDIEEDRERLKRESEDRLIREEAVHRAKMDRHRRSGTLF